MLHSWFIMFAFINGFFFSRTAKAYLKWSIQHCKHKNDTMLNTNSNRILLGPWGKKWTTLKLGFASEVLFMLLLERCKKCYFNLLQIELFSLNHFFHVFTEALWLLLYFITLLSDVFRTLPNIDDGSFLRK